MINLPLGYLMLSQTSLRYFCRYPFFLRLLTKYLAIHPELSNAYSYPSPTNIPEFFPLFTDEAGTFDTILGRMGIITDIRQLLVRILALFSISRTIIPEEELLPTIGTNTSPPYFRLLSSGILLKRDIYGQANIELNPNYRELLFELKKRSRIDSTGKPKIKLSSIPIHEAQRQFRYYCDIGIEALTALKLDEAMEHFQFANQIAKEKLFDLASEHEIAQLITKTENLQKALKYCAYLIDQITKEIEQDQLNLADAQINEAIQISQEYHFEIDQIPILRNHIKLKRLDMQGKNFQTENKWIEARDTFRELQQLSTELGWTEWIQYASNQIHLSEIKIEASEKKQKQQDELKRIQFEKEQKKQMELENERNKIHLFNGAHLITSNFNFMRNLERIFNKIIPLVSKVKRTTFGFVAHNHQVIELSLYHQDLLTLPENIEQLQNLRILGLSSNKIQEIPQRIRELQALISLDLSFNSLISILSDIRELPNLKELILVHNKLKYLPDDVKKAFKILEQQGCKILL